MVDFSDLLRDIEKLSPLEGKTLTADHASLVDSLRRNIATLCQAEGEGHDVGRRALTDHLRRSFENALRSHGIHSGRIAELGGAATSFLAEMQSFELQFLSIFPNLSDPRFRVADISNCPHIADATYDAIFSKNVLEHVIDAPSAAQEIVRILKPGGVTMHAVPFSYFFHGAPADYWRMTTTALQTLFSDLDTVDCRFYGGNRRVNNCGSAACAVDRDGGPQFSPDAFGGWRETWHTIYIGRKPQNGFSSAHQQRRKQFCLDLLKSLDEQGRPIAESIDIVLSVVPGVSIDALGKMTVGPPNKSSADWLPTREALATLWSTRGKKTLRPSTARFARFEILKAAGMIAAQ